MHTLAVEELQILREKVTHELQRRKVRATKQIEMIDAAISKVRRGPKKGTKFGPRYVGPNNETWTGRGNRPRWLTILINAGRSLDEFKVHQS